MAFPSAFLDDLAARNPIEDVVGQYVVLTRRGSNLLRRTRISTTASAATRAAGR